MNKKLLTLVPAAFIALAPLAASAADKPAAKGVAPAYPSKKADAAHDMKKDMKQGMKDEKSAMDGKSDRPSVNTGKGVAPKYPQGKAAQSNVDTTREMPKAGKQPGVAPAYPKPAAKPAG